MPETKDGDGVLALLGAAARQELAQRAEQAGLTSAALAAETLARELIEADNRESDSSRSRRDDSRRLLVPRLVHELRTPVGSLLMLSEMLEAEAGDQNPRAAHNAGRVRMIASDILVVLEEVAELNALQRGTAVLQPKAVSLPGLVAELERDHRAAAAEVGAELEVTLDPDAPTVMQTDRELLSNVLDKLLEGAIRAGAGNRVEVRVSPRQTTGGLGVAFSFVDRGAPLPSGAERRLFEPFGLADSRTRRAHGGFSLALPIAALAARALGGELSVCSKPGSTCFTLVLPSQPALGADGPGRP
jgi:signal transduction histidine kinase